MSYCLFHNEKKTYVFNLNKTQAGVNKYFSLK